MYLLHLFQYQTESQVWRFEDNKYVQQKKQESKKVEGQNWLQHTGTIFISTWDKKMGESPLWCSAFVIWQSSPAKSGPSMKSIQGNSKF